MSDKIKYLYDNKEISNILAEGFAKICQQKPKFPINYLARYLKNHTVKNNQKTALIDRLESNQRTNQKILQQQAQLQQQLLKKLQNQKVKAMQKEQFLTKISSTQRHEEVMDHFCEWVNQRLHLSGVYIGQLEHQVKKINLNEEDGEEAHLQLEKQKIIKFKYASEGQKRIVVGKILTQQSVVGKLLNEPPVDEPPAEEEGGENQQAKTPQTKGEIYFPSVVGNQDLKFFRFPKLGSYFASTLTIKSYLKEKLFDQNTVKIENYRKVLHDFEKEMEEKEAKFKEAYDEKVNAGAEQKELQEMEKEFQRQKNEIKKPVQEDFSFFERKFVVCADTLGLDREITEKQKQQLRQFILHLKQSWQIQEKSQLQKDIELYSSLSKPQHEQGHDAEGINFQEQFTTLIEEEDKEIPSHEQVDKVKDNEKLFELESNTVRLEKTKEYMIEEKNLKFWDHLLELHTVKYQQVIKQFLILFDFRKEDFCFKGTNVLDWQKTKNLLKTQQPKIFERINTLNARGSRPQIVQSYAKVPRISKNLQGLQPLAIVNYNFYLGLILRLVQLYTKVRVQDREARVAKIQTERENREQKIKEAEEKAIEKKEKLDTLKADLEEKGELEAFDEEAWKNQYDEQNPPIEVPDEIPNDIDRDLQDAPQGQEAGQKAAE